MSVLLILQLMVDGVTGEVMVLVQLLVAMVPARDQGRVKILHLLLVGGRVREQIQTHKHAHFILVQVCMDVT